jgi:hypothetical protein
LIKVFDSWEITNNEYEELFNEIIENQKKNCIKDKQNETIVKIKYFKVYKIHLRKN